MTISTPPARRCLNIVERMVVYRVIGRRPSAVYVDEQGQPTTDASGTRHRLWDLVFDEYVAEPGDQIQDRHSQITLVAGDGECSRVQLTTPTPRTLDNAFSHASRTLTADWAALDRLVAEGRLDGKGMFLASEVLAKHDEKYMPKEVSEALKKSGRWQEEEGQAKK